MSRRLGEGSGVFQQLCKIWKHAAVSKARKMQIYASCVLSKVLSSLDSLWLLKADRARLDAFHCRCLRKILGIPHSSFSRISNATVLARAGAEPLSATLRDRQVKLYGKTASQADDSLVKRVVCNADGTPKGWDLRRRRGRPRQLWAQSVYKIT